MESWKSKSLEHINIQFRSIMEGMGIDEEKQHKLAAKLNLSKKIRTITSMQTLDERKRKIREYVVKLRDRNSVLNLLSLSVSLEIGPKVLYEIFSAEGGHDVLVKCMRRMDEEFSDVVCDALYIVLSKYGNHFPLFLRILLDGFLAGKIHETKSFFKILEFLVNENKADELFFNIDFNRCVCNTYLSKVIEYIRNLPKIDEELNFVVPLLRSPKSVHVKYILFVSDFPLLEQRVSNREVFEELAREIRPAACADWRKDRINEVMRLAEIEGVLDVACCVFEAFVFGDRKVFGSLLESMEKVGIYEEKDDGGKEKAVEIESRKDAAKKPEASKGRGPKKIIRKTGKSQTPAKRYIQVKWTKMGKGNSVWSKINMEEMERVFKAEEFDGFEVRGEKPRASSAETEKRRPSVFSEKKNYAINIALGRVKESNCDLKSAILGMEERLSENLVKQLLFYFPTDDEIEQLQSTDSVFGRGEEFFKECIEDIELMKRCLYYLYFIISFRNQNVTKTLETLERYYSMLLESKELRRFLGIALAAGNHLNKGSFLGNAEGFTMESIPRILEVKSNGSSMVSLLRKKIDCAQLLKDLSVVYDASGVNFEGLCIEVEELKKNYINASGSAFPQIQEKMEKIQEKYEAICSLYDKVTKLHRDCREYFGEKIDDGFSSRIILLLDRMARDVQKK
ncbi:similarity to formin [Encephalitozoon cuniculi GB-M1]|uniref:Similarity to formin n=1 Tax=Encephalitozoon cuniculi (strain GB-M1) TaxID=284813 RepID=Q8SUX7_ENCCU|nr:formin homology 2 domain-containing protein [Encephalitozoon cuniculi GB-M1]KMV65847.1 formin homology 2 domain-containing protein [Encephalitozoon cuniculi EcunIII-L]UYI27286.1 formin homology 2 domain-containing protein [Encephalitozoon cuniculi]CAD25655.2 similarity to formin [Encephalitozoon cuniculi GB-M1]